MCFKYLVSCVLGLVSCPEEGGSLLPKVVYCFEYFCDHGKKVRVNANDITHVQTLSKTYM